MLEINLETKKFWKTIESLQNSQARILELKKKTKKWTG